MGLFVWLTLVLAVVDGGVGSGLGVFLFGLGSFMILGGGGILFTAGGSGVTALSRLCWLLTSVSWCVCGGRLVTCLGGRWVGGRFLSWWWLGGLCWRVIGLFSVHLNLSLGLI